MKRIKINYKSDFDFFLDLIDAEGKEVKATDCDWTAQIFTFSKKEVFVASYIKGKYSNCFLDNGRIHVVLDNHNLLPGTLRIEVTAELPNDIYPDGRRRLVKAKPVDIELVCGEDDAPTDINIEYMLPYIKGDDGKPFTYADFTPAEIAELQRPAIEAANTANTAANRVDEAIKGLNKLESQVAAAETERQQAESTRNTRLTTIETELKSKANCTELSNVMAVDPEEPIEAADPNLETTALRKVEQLLTPQEQAQVMANLGRPDRATFNYMWNEAWGEYGCYDPENAPDPEHSYMGNDLWMTYEEAIDILLYGVMLEGVTFQKRKVRTNLPLKIASNGNVSCADFFRQSTIEAVRIFSGPWWAGANTTNMFYYCTNLKTIINPIILHAGLSNNLTGMFVGCNALQNVEIKNLNADINFASCSLLSFASLRYMIDNAANTKPITITVHPGVYAKLTGDTENEAAAVLTEEDAAAWQQVLADAAEKNILFATA